MCTDVGLVVFAGRQGSWPSVRKCGLLARTAPPVASERQQLRTGSPENKDALGGSFLISVYLWWEANRVSKEADPLPPEKSRSAA